MTPWLVPSVVDDWNGGRRDNIGGRRRDAQLGHISTRVRDELDELRPCSI